MAAPTCTTEGATLDWHCDSPSCEWWRCPECRATYDMERGVRVLFGGTVETTAD